MPLFRSTAWERGSISNAGNALCKHAGPCSRGTRDSTYTYSALSPSESSYRWAIAEGYLTFPEGVPRAERGPYLQRELKARGTVDTLAEDAWKRETFVPVP